MPEYIRQIEVAKMLNTSSATVQQLILRGVLHSHKQGTSVNISLEELVELLDSDSRYVRDDLKKALRVALVERGVLDESTFEYEQDDEDDEEIEDNALLEQRISIYEQPANANTDTMNVISLYNEYLAGQLSLDLDIQREFVWDKKKASGFVHSLIHRFPTPIIFLSKEEDGKRVVIDGKQRLTSIFWYLNGLWENDGTPFRLTKLFPNNVEDPKLSNRRFDQLDLGSQNALKWASMPVTTVYEPFRPDVKRDIFIRLNYRSTALTQQQLRNALYYSPFMAFVRQLSKDAQLRKLVIPARSRTKESEYQESVLRFVAFQTNDPFAFRGSINQFLNLTAHQHRDKGEPFFEEMVKRFGVALSRNEQLFADKTFVRFNPGSLLGDRNGRWSINSTNKFIYELMMWGVLTIDEEEFIRYHDPLREGLLHFFANNRIIRGHIGGEISTGKNKQAKERLSIYQNYLQDLLERLRVTEQPFSYQWKWQRFALTDRCAVCKNPINNRDDAAVLGGNRYWIEQPKGEVSFAHRCCVDY